MATGTGVARNAERLEVASLDTHCRQLPMTATGKKMQFRVREMAIVDAAAGLLARR